MGLLSVFKKEKKKEETKQTKQFEPLVVKTDNVPATLKEIALKYSTSHLDCRVLRFETYIKLGKDDWLEVEESDWESFRQEEIVLSPKFSIKQEYEIEVFPYKEERWERDLILHIVSNKEKNRVLGKIKEGSILYETPHLFQKLKERIYAKMVRAKMIIGIWDSDFESILSDYVTKVQLEKKWIFSEGAEFDVASCWPAKPSKNDKIIYHYKEKEKQQRQKGDRIDYAQRGFVHGVEKGEVIIEYRKPMMGRSGRNCQGVFIPIREPQQNHKPNFGISDAIDVEENEMAIIYRAKRAGYVVFEDGRYDIRDEMHIDEANFKKTGSIEAGVKTEVKIQINESDALKEAIGPGIEVEATHIRVEGNVASSAIVKAEEVEIGGQTHQSSKIFADKAKVGVLRGLLLAKEHAKIGRIEGGSVEARKVEVGQMIGGEAKGLEVHVEKIGANVKIYAAQKIVIDEMVGENNKLILDPTDISIYHDEILALEERIKEQEKEIERQSEQLTHKEALVEKSESSVMMLRQKILADKAKGIAPKPAFVAKIKQFQALKARLEQEKRNLQALHQSLENTKTQLLTFQEIVTKAQVLNHGSWKPYTTIEFHLLCPQMKLEFRPKPGMGNEVVYLKKSDEGYEVAVKKVDA